MYDDDIDGIATSFLSETIRVDIEGIIKRYYVQYPESRVKLIPVASGGYMGTQFEGYFQTLYSILQHVEMKKEKHDRINVITGMLSPSDVRIIKDILSLFPIEYILLPDASDNLDRGYEANYKRLPDKGTTLEQIAMMAGSRLTIELSLFCPAECSPGEYLKETYGVPLVRLSPPVRLKNTDAFIRMPESICRWPPAAISSANTVSENLIAPMKAALESPPGSLRPKKPCSTFWMRKSG